MTLALGPVPKRPAIAHTAAGAGPARIRLVDISVCVPAIRASTLGATVASIRRQTHTAWELIVVGQGEDRTVRQLTTEVARLDPRVRYVHSPLRGLSRARNAGLRAAAGAVVAMTDDDCEAAPDWLAIILACLAEDPAVVLVGGALVAPPGAGRLARCPSLVPSDAVYDPAATGRRPPPGWDFVGANLAIRRDVARRVGDFDDHLGAGSDFGAAEETDFKLRLEALGLRMRSTPRAVVHHTHGCRRGLRAVLASQRAYARGNGALAAKLTLMGDERGREWLEATRRDAAAGWLRSRRPQRLPVDARRWWHFSSAYRECLRRFTLGEDGRLAPRSSPAPLTGSA